MLTVWGVFQTRSGLVSVAALHPLSGRLRVDKKAGMSQMT